MQRLSTEDPDRFIGSRGHKRAFSYLKNLLESWGLIVSVQNFLVDITVPVKWSMELDLGKGYREVDCLPGLGSPTVKKLESEILPVGYAREEDYASLDPTNNRVHLTRLWKSHETAKVREAALHGASALLWYNEYFDELYSGACDYSLAPIAGVAIRNSIAARILEAGGGRIRLSIKSKRRKIRCRNIEASREKDTGRHCILASHYDSRPHTPGASDDASGVAVMLAYIRAQYDREATMPIKFLFADCEEEGCIGAETYADHLYRKNLLKNIAAVVNLDAVGWPNLCLITRDREAVMDEGLSRLASQVLEELGYSVDMARSKSGKSNHTPFAKRGVPALWMSDYPNYIRHSSIDNAFNIDYPTMTLVTESLRSIFARID